MKVSRLVLSMIIMLGTLRAARIETARNPEEVKLIQLNVTLIKTDEISDELWAHYVEHALELQKTKGMPGRSNHALDTLISKSNVTPPLMMVNVDFADGKCACNCGENNSCRCSNQYAGVCPCDVLPARCNQGKTATCCK